jgi:hypothetical protein
LLDAICALSQCGFKSIKFTARQVRAVFVLPGNASQFLHDCLNLSLMLPLMFPCIKGMGFEMNLIE